MRGVKSVAQLVGNTPLVRLQRVTSNLSPRVHVLAKLESANPAGSVKDRPALYMFQEAEKRGEIDKDTRIIEATSGNTGIALAMVAAIKGYKIELVMPANATEERVTSMLAYGAKVTLTPADQAMEGARDYAEAEFAKGGCVMLNQFANPDNPLAHFETTGPEIWRDTEGKVTHFVSSMGTTGTIMGVSRYFSEKHPEAGVKIIGVQPSEGSRIVGIRRWPPEYVPKIKEQSRIHEEIDVSEEQAEEMTRRLAREEGIFSGVSSGGAMHVALEVASKLDEGVVVCIVCDSGDKYLSMDLFKK